MSLSERLKHLENNNSTYKNYRFFDCIGKPEDCKVHLIGINPSKGLPNNNEFWKYWDEKNGFDFAGWLNDYSKENSKWKDGLKPTRKRIEHLREGLSKEGIKLLNYNIHAKATKREKDLIFEDKKLDVFEIILSELKPELIILHGNTPKKHFEKMSSNINSQSPNWEIINAQINNHNVKIITIPHLFNLALDQEKSPNITYLIDLVIKGINGYS